MLLSLTDLQVYVRYYIILLLKAVINKSSFISAHDNVFLDATLVAARHEYITASDLSSAAARA